MAEPAVPSAASPPASPAAAWGLRLLALAAYGGFLATSLYFAAFLLDLGPAKTVDRGGGLGGPPWVTDLVLLLLFCGHHSLFARRGVKQWLARRLPPAAERSVYVLVATALLALLIVGWEPLPATLWQVADPAGRVLLYAVNGLGWLIVVAATFQIDHWALFGLRQGFAARGASADGAFRTPWMYRWSRHPMMFGFLLVLWAAPSVSVGRLGLALLLTLYIVVGTRLEERDLLRLFGAAYARYRERVPALLPWRGPVLPRDEPS